MISLVASVKDNLNVDDIAEEVIKGYKNDLKGLIIADDTLFFRLKESKKVQDRPRVKELRKLCQGFISDLLTRTNPNKLGLNENVKIFLLWVLPFGHILHRNDKKE